MNCKTFSLSEVVETVIDNRGLTPKKLGGDWSDGGYRVISAKNIKNRSLVQEDKIRTIDDSLYSRWMDEDIHKGDIILTSEAPCGETLFWDSDEKIVLGQRLFGIRVKKGYDPYYLFLYMNTRRFQNELSSRMTGTTVQGIRQSELMKCRLTLPSYDVQVAVTKQIKPIDDLIRLNDRINDYLLELSKSILSFHIFKEETMLVNLGELVDVIDCLHSKKPELIDEGKLFLQLGNIRDDGLLDVSRPYFISDEDYKLWTSRCEVREGDCVITNVGRIGAVSQVPWYVRAAMGRNMTCIRCKNNFNYPAFLITSMLSDYMCQEIMLNTDEGTILGALNVRSIPKLQVIKFDDTTMMKIESLLKPIRHQMEVLLVENNELKKIRDSMIAQIMR